MNQNQAALQMYVEQLAKGHGFTVAELAANRARQIHPLQVARGRGAGIGWGIALLVLAVVVLGGGVGGALLLYDDLRPPVSQVDMNGVYALAAGGVLVAGALALGAVMMFVNVGRRRRLYERGEVGVLEAPVQKVHIRRKGGDEHRYNFGPQSFQVPRAGWQLVTAGARYRVYFVAGDLLSIEPA